jgi:P-type conjugative transfer ATPase TrbB
VTNQETRERRLDEILRRQLGVKILAMIEDPSITDILVNDDGKVWYEARGGLVDAQFALTASQVESIIGTAAASLGAVANAEHPIVEGELPIGRIRFEGLLPPVARKPCFVLRLPAHVLYTLANYENDGIITEEQARVFRYAIKQKQNIAIGGGTGSGKTTLGGALINEMVLLSEPVTRFVIIEDTLEIQCKARNLVQLHTSEHADMTRLVRATMRLRPDHIIVGEVRGGEALALLKAWGTGHPGGVTTVHANSAASILTRLSTLVQEAGVPPQPEMIAETINLLVFIERTPEGRRVTEMLSVDGFDQNKGFLTSAIEGKGELV